jgi:RNA polymerase sigma factor (sigma-70 family)
MDDALLRYRSRFCRSAFRYLGNAADAEDAVQDALLSAYKHLSKFRGQARISTWLSAIVINSARMQLRRRSRQPHVPLDEQSPEQESHALCDRLADRGQTPEEACRGAELAEHVHRLLRQLSPTLRRAFQLRELDGLTIRETANLAALGYRKRRCKSEGALLYGESTGFDRTGAPRVPGRAHGSGQGESPAVSLKNLKTGETNYEGPMHASERKH